MEAAAKTEAKAPGGAEEDLSMEEILHSIRKIIAEDDVDGKKPNGKAKGEDDVPGSEVLELTKWWQRNGSVVSLKPKRQPPRPDVLQTIDQALAPENPSKNLLRPQSSHRLHP